MIANENLKEEAYSLMYYYFLWAKILVTAFQHLFFFFFCKNTIRQNIHRSTWLRNWYDAVIIKVFFFFFWGAFFEELYTTLLWETDNRESKPWKA